MDGGARRPRFSLSGRWRPGRGRIMRLLPVNQQVVVVVGASSGIGRATALRFAAKGARVVVAARNEDGLATLVQEIRDRKGEALAVVADVADPDQVKKVAAKAIDAYGRIDTWA